ncbi:MAG: magnesium/cobalt transporter CorA [bacterium]
MASHNKKSYLHLFKQKRRLRGGSSALVTNKDAKSITKVTVTQVSYFSTGVQKKSINNIQELTKLAKDRVHWINVVGLNNAKKIKELAEVFQLHPLLVEDISQTDQRPKVEDFGNALSLIVKMLRYDEKKNDVIVEQVTFVIGSNWVLSFQEKAGDVFDSVRERIDGGKGRIRKSGADYLAYALLDTIVDHYFTILEHVGENLELVENELLTNPSDKTLHQINQFKQEAILLRRSVWPLRDVIGRLERVEFSQIKNETVFFIRDVYDHTIQVIETIESYRDILSSMVDLYLSSVSNRMNAVMKVLTIIATIFIPLTFVTGIYGMNFRFMPELEQSWGYPAVLLVMLIAAIGMIWYFKRKHWF